MLNNNFFYQCITYKTKQEEYFAAFDIKQIVNLPYTRKRRSFERAKENCQKKNKIKTFKMEANFSLNLLFNIKL